MSFVDQEDIFNEIEPVHMKLLVEFSNFSVSKPPFERIKYSDSNQKLAQINQILKPLIVYNATDCL